MKSNSRQTVALMFADIKGYSKLGDDTLYEKLSHIFKHEILERVTSDDVILLKTVGDGVILYSFTTAPLANSALELRDKFRNYNWLASGFTDNLQIRVALHLDEVIVERNSSSQVIDLTGNGVIKAARIEPMTPLNSVYCSQVFQVMLANSNSANLKAIAQGTMKLAKDYGEMPVFEVLWYHESSKLNTTSTQQNNQINIPMPNINGQFTDKQKTDYLYSSILKIKAYFEQAINQLNSQNTHYEATIRIINDTKFTCEIYVNGNLKSRCKIWIGNMVGRFEYICFDTGNFRINEDNGWSDNVSVEVENSQLRLKSNMGMTSFLRDFDIQSASTPEQIGEYFWRRLTVTL